MNIKIRLGMLMSATVGLLLLVTGFETAEAWAEIRKPRRLALILKPL